MFNILDVKMIIWDLDNTLWKGTISEEDVDLPDENIELIQQLIGKGIMNSICSKNDYQTAKAALLYAGLWDYFIFPTISWEPKGENIKTIIKDAQLRPQNVLFIDDNTGNLEEALFYVPELMTLNASEINILREQIGKIPEALDGYKRLENYKLLETRNTALKQAVDNHDFLVQSDIHVAIENDAIAHLDRIYELVQRTNQLNFTKKRSTKEELASLIDRNGVSCGTVKVSDRYGDYGIVGFYAVEAKNAIHFLFSCRIMGMGIEQWIYAKLGYPQLSVVGEVASSVGREEAPAWITDSPPKTSSGFNNSLQNGKKPNILMTGGCDLMALSYYLQDNANVSTEFDYVSSKTGQYTPAVHTELLVQSLKYPESKQRLIKKTIPFYDERTFSTTFFKKKYDVIVTSILNDAFGGLYVNKDRDKHETILFDDYIRPLKTQKDWQNLLLRGYQNVMTKELCTQFYHHYKFVGPISDARLDLNLEFIRKHLDPNTLLIFLNAAEINVVLNGEVGRHLRHIQVNKVLKAFCDRHPENVALLDVNEFVHSEEDLGDILRHYQRRVYFEIAQKLLRMINTRKGCTLNILEKTAGTPFDRLNDILMTNRQIFFYGATRQAIELYKQFSFRSPILIDHCPACSGQNTPIVYSPEKLSEYNPDSIFVIVMDRHENSEAITFLQSMGLKGYKHYIIWPNYVWRINFVNHDASHC